MNKIGLIIQGPIISKGHDGNLNINTFNSITNINKIINEYGYLFDQIVISTWKNEKTTNLNIEKYHKKTSIIKLNTINASNKFKQYYSMFKGINKLKDDIKYVIKIRTDIHINLKELVSFLDKNKNLDKIYVPLFNFSRNFLIHDFYYAGTKKTLKNFSETIIKNNFEEFSNDAHHEIFLKYLFYNKANEIGITKKSTYKEMDKGFLGSFKRTFSNLGLNIHFNKIFYFGIKNVFIPLPKSIFITLKWRGKGILGSYINENSHAIFFENVGKIGFSNFFGFILNNLKFIKRYFILIIKI